MAPPTPRSPPHSQIALKTLPKFLLLPLLILLFVLPQSQSLNLTALLAPYPDFSAFSSLIVSAAPDLVFDLADRSSLTVLAVPNRYLAPSEEFTRRLTPSALADLLRYHVLLECLSWSSLRRLPPSGSIVTTLLQTTGRAPSNSGAVNLTRDPLSGAISAFSGNSNATVLSLVASEAYNYTVLAVNALLVPSGLSLMASDAGGPPPAGINITSALAGGHDFNTVMSVLSGSGVVEEFEADEIGAGITLFMPTDKAFSDLPPSASFHFLPADRKAVILKFHVLHAYYPLGTLERITNPVEPTLATDDMGAGRFTLNISRVNGSVCVDSGIVQASITQTVFDQNPVAIFGISKVLLPKEYFAKGGAATNTPSSAGSDNGSGAEAPDPSTNAAPVGSPGFREEMKSGACLVRRLDLGLFCCIWLYLLLI